jgi:hypothetical protein
MGYETTLKYELPCGCQIYSEEHDFFSGAEKIIAHCSRHHAEKVEEQAVRQREELRRKHEREEFKRQLVVDLTELRATSLKKLKTEITGITGDLSVRHERQRPGQVIVRVCGGDLICTLRAVRGGWEVQDIEQTT